MRKWRWVTLCRIGDVEVWPSLIPPRLADFYWIDGTYNSSPALICPKEFKRLFGFLPPTDKAVKVIFTAKVVK